MVPPLAKGNGRNKRMIRSIYTYFQSVITDPCTGMVWKKKEEEEDRGGAERKLAEAGCVALADYRAGTRCSIGNFFH